MAARAPNVMAFEPNLMTQEERELAIFMEKKKEFIRSSIASLTPCSTQALRVRCIADGVYTASIYDMAPEVPVKIPSGAEPLCVSDVELSRIKAIWSASYAAYLQGHASTFFLIFEATNHKVVTIIADRRLRGRERKDVVENAHHDSSLKHVDVKQFKNQLHSALLRRFADGTEPERQHILNFCVKFMMPTLYATVYDPRNKESRVKLRRQRGVVEIVVPSFTHVASIAFVGRTGANEEGSDLQEQEQHVLASFHFLPQHPQTDSERQAIESYAHLRLGSEFVVRVVCYYTDPATQQRRSIASIETMTLASKFHPASLDMSRSQDPDVIAALVACGEAVTRDCEESLACSRVVCDEEPQEEQAPSLPHVSIEARKVMSISQRKRLAKKRQQQRKFEHQQHQVSGAERFLVAEEQASEPGEI